MLDDVVGGLAKGALRLLFWIFVEVIMFYTGEIMLTIVTFGRKKPRWDFYGNISSGKWVIFTEISTYIGFATWLCIFGYIFQKFTGN